MRSPGRRYRITVGWAAITEAGERALAGSFAPRKVSPTRAVADSKSECDCAMQERSSGFCVGLCRRTRWPLEISMFNPWFSLSLDAAKLAFKLTRIMVGGVSYPVGSSDIGEAHRAPVPISQAQVPVAHMPAPVAEVQESPAPVAIALDNRPKSATKPRVQKKPSRTKGRHASKRAARAAAPKRAAASLVRAKAIRRSARKKGK
jgi:hypothetical protein